ncbi:MAG: tRNA (N(6)-L-threonylcarbamoyladenosine(37)-C(2))-methylthiotransferase [Thermoproteales archaeon]|nr:tRNA (N(6)-L-threonylcarbamoyladenosine(37)-C(2))-methylthiotransferase [Thermoproteales archaeon]
MNKNVYIETYGCWLNRGESDIIKDFISNARYDITKKIEDADIVIINTCAIREETEYNMLRRIQELEKLRQTYGFKFIITGCLVNVRPKTILNIAPEASLIEPDALHKLPHALSNSNQIIIIRQYKRNKDLLPRYKGGITYIVPIQSGCLGNCAFCIEWITRGRGVKSVSNKNIVEKIKDAVKRGAKEIILTGQDIATYGVDIGTNLISLIENILENVRGDYWIRLGMMEPWTTKKFAEVLASLLKDERIYSYLHLPVQSGDNDVLKLMRRKYTVEEYKTLISIFREKNRKINLVSDIIVGFPGEKEKNFLNTVNFLKKIKFDKVHVARYSLRPFTQAYLLHQVSESEKKRRSRIVSKICLEIAHEINKTYIGSRKIVLIKEKGKKSSYIGRTKEFKPVVFYEYSLSIGEKVKAKIIDATPLYLIGKVID